MDEQRAWLKARRKRRLRILAVMLSFCVLFHTYPDILATLSVLAAVESVQPEVRHITGFTALSEEIREQTVPLGTLLSELTLPDTLEAVVTEQLSEDTEDKTDDGGKEDAGENGSGEDSEENDGEEPDGTEDEDGGTGETEEGEPSDSEQDDTETGGETGDKDAETGDGQDEQPEDGESEETDGTTETENGDEGDSETEENSEGESAPAEEQGGSENGQENAPSEEQPESASAQETHTVTMPEYLSENVVSVQTLENTQTEKQEETVTIDGVTWQSEPEYDENTEGTYIFTAILPDGYALAEGVSLPQITVTVENGIDAVIQILRDRIAALPDAEEYLALEPDEEDEDAYAEWEEKLYAYAEEALAIWEEYEALTGEQQAQISEEELAKLEAWLEIAETLSDNNAVMLADYSEHHGDDDWTALSADTTEESTLSGGKYYLSDNDGDKNIAMGTISIDGDVTLCLNGQTLTHSGDTRSVIVVNSGTFTLCDCENDTGCITGGKGELEGNSLYGGGIYVCKGAQLIMRGGTIRGNTAKYGGGISIGGDNNNAGTYFTMSGGVIEDNTASSHGGGIFCGGIGEMTITNGVIRNNTASSRGAGIFAGTTATVNLLANGETDKVSICGNKIVGSNGNGGGYTDFQKAILKIEGNVNITGNKRDQDENNIALLNGRVILLTDELTGSFGVTTWNAPYSENNTDVNSPYKTTVQGTDGYIVSPQDLARINSDDTQYSVLMIEGNIVGAANGETGKVLVLGNKDTGNLSGMDLSIKDGSSGEEIKLSPNFAETTYEYAVTVPNSVKAVSIVATPKNADAAVAMTIQNADNATDTTVQADNILLAEGENTIKVNVTEGDASKVYIVTITREAPAGNPVTITAYKDGAEWKDSVPVFKLISDNGSNFVTDLAAVPDGTYSIYYDYDGATNIDTGKTVNVNGAPPDDIRVDYFTVTFYDEGKVLTSPAQQIVLEGAAASAPATNPTKTGYTFSKWVTIDGGSMGYDFANETVTGTTSIYASWTSDTYTITYKLTGGTLPAGKTNPTTYTIETAEFTLQNPERTGYTFTGWSGTGLTANTTTVTISKGSTGDREYTANWEAETYTVTLNGKGDSGSDLIGYTYGTGATLPIDWTKTGYSFAGWYDNKDCTGTPVTEISATDTGNKTFWAKWTPQTYQVTFEYHGADGGDSTASKNVTYDSKYGTLPVPSRTGYTFKGWYTAEAEGQGTEVNAETTVTTASAHTLHARWKDETAPNKPILQDNVTLPTDWTNAQDKIPLKLYDGVGVAELWVSVDGKDYIKVDGFSGNTGSMAYDYTPVLEGEREPGKGHTYQFKAKDAAGNTSAESDLFTVKLDKTKPVIGTLTYENAVHLNLWHWIIGKKSMVVHVPVTDTGSGVTQISYKQTSRKADGTLDSTSAEEKKVEVKDGEAKITFDKDFHGIITINCTDKAGNAADSVTIGTEGEGGVIVEDTPPVITTNARTDYYDTPTDIQMTVKDDPENAISAGIAAITYKVGEDGEEQPVTVGTNALQTEITFTIPASEIPTGITEITVTATDNAGNGGNEASKTFTVKVKGPEKQPAAEIDYRQEKLAKLVPGGKYTIDGTEYTADTDGCIPIKEGWLGTTLSIIKKGNGSETTDSTAQSLSVPARPTAPGAPELSARTDNSITLKTIIGAQYRLADGTENWQDSTAFTGLVQKTIYKFKAYYPATDTSFASPESGEAQIATMPTAPTKEKLQIGYIAETITLTDGIEAFTDAGGQTPVTGTDVTTYMGQTLYIRYPAKGIIPASLTTAVTIPPRPAKPTPGKTDASYPTATDGAIIGLISGTTYEYRVKNTDGSFGAWKDATPSGTKIENLPAGEYEIRVKAVETSGSVSFRSEAAVVTVGAKPGIKITFMANGEEYTVRYTKSGGTLTEIPPVPPKNNAGDQTYTREWCSDEQGTTPAVFTNVAADMTVYAVYTTAYTVTLQGGTGYTLSAGTGSQSPVKEGGSFTFRFTLSNGYQRTNSFAAKVNGSTVELTAQEPYTYTISDIRENKVVTVEGVAKKPGGKPSGSGGHKEDGSKPDPEESAPKPEDQVPDNPAPKPENQVPDNPAPKPSVTPSAKPTPPDPEPGDTLPAEKQPESRPGTAPKNEEAAAPEETTEPEEPGTDSADAGTLEPDGTETETADSTGSGQPKGTPAQQEEVKLGNGTVIVTVVCEEEKCTAVVADTEAVVKAVLTPDQQAIVNGGETIEIRIDVTDISEKVPAQDKEVIESGIEAYSEEVPGLVLGMYVDISMFIKIGAGDWNAITETDEPIEVVINIPEKLQSDGREYYIIRAHNGEYTFMNDIDDTPETITISTELFSSYAIAYVEMDGTDTDAKCGLCHICPTFLGICYFIWLAIILVVIVMIILVVLRRKKKEEMEGQK